MNRYLQLSLRQFLERQVNFYGTKIYFISWEFEHIFSIRPEQVQCNMKQPWQYLPLLLPPTLGLQSTCHQLIPLGDFISLNVCARCSNRSMTQRWCSFLDAHTFGVVQSHTKQLHDFSHNEVHGLGWSRKRFWRFVLTVVTVFTFLLSQT